MTASSTYPLAPLLRLRSQIRDARRRALADAVRRIESAEAAEQNARAELEAGQEALSHQRRQLTDGGPRPAGAFQNQQRYIQGLELEVQRQELRWQEVQRALVERQKQLAAARQALVRAQTELEAIEQDRQTWDEKQRREALRRAEQELEEIVAARDAQRSG